jgi:predicted double-glycine peptidase
MNPWVETILALLACLLGVAFGRICASWKRPWWLLGYVAPLAVVIAYGVWVRSPELATTPLFSWILIGRWRYVLVGAGVAALMTTLRMKLPKPNDQRALAALTVVVLVYVTFWPSAAAIFNRSFLAGIPTKIDQFGVCRQTTDYTCGPAAAVTGLLRLGLRSDEGDLALHAHTSSAMGTPADVLANTINAKFGEAGVHARLRRFRTLDELKAAGLTLVVLKYGLQLDHWMCVLAFTKDAVIVGDPVSGPTRMGIREFEQRFRHIGVVLDRTNQPEPVVNRSQNPKAKTS